eukprot:366167-Chlamydomonas_euryale.AAC.10
MMLLKALTCCGQKSEPHIQQLPPPRLPQSRAQTQEAALAKDLQQMRLQAANACRRHQLPQLHDDLADALSAVQAVYRTRHTARPEHGRDHRSYLCKRAIAATGG